MSIGEQLRNARVARGLTASQVALATRMKVQTVEAIEQEDFSRIAAPIYAKGFIKLYAQCVGLDPGPLIEEYTTRFATDKRPRLPGRLPKDSGSAAAENRGGQLEPTTPRTSEEGELFATRSTGDGKTTTGPNETRKWTETGPAATRPTLGLSRLWGGFRTAGTLIGSRVTALGRKIAPALGNWYNVRRGQPRVGETDAAASERALVRKGMALAAAVVVVLVMLVSIFSHCVRWPTRSVSPESTLAEELNIAVEVPQPYFE